MVSVRLAKCPYLAKTFNIAIFFDMVNMIIVKLGILVVPVELYSFIPLSMTLIVFQGHSSVKKF